MTEIGINNWFKHRTHGNLASEKHLQLLQQRVIPQLTQIIPNKERENLPAKNIWFQHNGESPHFGRYLYEYMDQSFPIKLIEQREEFG